jgi:hypothetical protein
MIRPARSAESPARSRAARTGIDGLLAVAASLAPDGAHVDFREVARLAGLPYSSACRYRNALRSEGLWRWRCARTAPSLPGQGPAATAEPCPPPAKPASPRLPAGGGFAIGDAVDVDPRGPVAAGLSGRVLMADGDNLAIVVKHPGLGADAVRYYVVGIKRCRLVGDAVSPGEEASRGE